MDKNYDITYKGSLRCEATHLRSGSQLETDAPVDNNGKGERFSPTDLVATALVTCILTVVGIHFKKKGRELKPIHVETKKIMASNPRRIQEIKMLFDFGDNEFTAKEFEIIDGLVSNCPVSNSLSKEIVLTSNVASFYNL
jgi:putative redox protein